MSQFSTNSALHPGSHPWIIAITGASGTIYGRRLIQALVKSDAGFRIEVVVSDAALRVMAEEERIVTSAHSIKVASLIGAHSNAVTIHNNRDIGASIASGSYLTSGMVIVPCSMNTLAAVACGLAQNLIHRAADVTLKEKRKFVIVPRETPLSVIHLENMLKLAQLGAVITPAMPGFYHQPASIDDLVDKMVMRIMDQMGVESHLVKRWGEEQRKPRRALRSV